MTSELRRVVVLGSGFAGLLAAVAAAPYADVVTVIERDRLPTEPALRRGLPQAQHPHFLAPGGVMAIEKLLPGFVDRLYRRGAHRIGTYADLLFLPSTGGWMPRHPTGRFGISCSRQLLDQVIYTMAAELAPITFRQEVEPVRLLGTARAVTGVLLHSLGDGTTERLEADLVIDATGRGSRASRWLAELAITAPAIELIDSGHVYATRVFQAPAGAESGFPMVLIQADPGSGEPGGNATLLPIEDGRWIVTVGGTRGSRIPVDEDDFAAFARSGMRDPLVAELLTAAVPLTPIHRSRSTFNRRYRFDRARSWPGGFVIVGDAATALNPVYGQGMTAAARAATALGAALARSGLHSGTAIRLQRSIQRSAADAWSIAVSQDQQYSNTIGPTPHRVDRLRIRYGEKVLRAASTRRDMAALLTDVVFMVRPAWAMAHPTMAAGAVLGPRTEPLRTPPLTDRERCFVAGRT